ncbi:L-2-amino-thiazoline-4-carboxylic acid hydrolase [Leptospira stimsonii]|uniref:L-2-amino-thiazoline-4-carboxylic acid hydrolase n=1 Tax=Leptospira stimsonii TaxID=2202203 RepID=A0A8B3D1Q8_9LEPT|nr:L-2-amino-thiazoline-4-carboxylic acid hydrolase [Leptospira stimsonii]RHX88713.1 L-2-amino-thiazoline-4-carboxylic acid hydrolase [Leptospira stimsonii]
MFKFKRILSKNFWYELLQNITIWKTIKKTSKFSSFEIKKIREEYNRLKKTNRIFIRDIQSEYHVSWCSIILSIYKACLGKGMKNADAIRLTEEIIFSNMNAEGISKFIETALDKSKDPFNFIVTASKQQETNFFGNTFRFSRIKDGFDSYHVHVNECMYNEFFKENAYPELMTIACKWDMISWSRGIKQEKHKIFFERPVTLGLNGEDCKFKFERILLDKIETSKNKTL